MITIHLGDRVTYRPEAGTGAARSATVMAIRLLQSSDGPHDGTDVNQACLDAPRSDDSFVFDFGNRHWCYAWQLQMGMNSNEEQP